MLFPSASCMTDTFHLPSCFSNKVSLTSLFFLRIPSDFIWYANSLGMYSGGVILPASQSSNVRTGMPVCSENSLRDIPVLSLKSKPDKFRNIAYCCCIVYNTFLIHSFHRLLHLWFYNNLPSTHSASHKNPLFGCSRVPKARSFPHAVSFFQVPNIPRTRMVTGFLHPLLFSMFKQSCLLHLAYRPFDFTNVWRVRE